MKKRTAIFVACIALAIATVAWAGPGRRRMEGMQRGEFGMMRLEHLRQELDLSDAQVDQIKAVFKDLHEQNAANRQQSRDSFGDVRKALIADPNNVAAAQALLDKQLQSERTMRSNALAAYAKALNVLTPEQRTKLGSLLADRAPRLRMEQ